MKTAAAVSVAFTLGLTWPAARPATPPADGDGVYQLTALHHIRISLSAAEWNVMQTSSARNGVGGGGTDVKQADGRMVHTGSGFSGYFPWAHADVVLDDVEFKDAGLRYKGNFSFMSSSANAPLVANFKLKLDEYSGKGVWDGEKTFNLHPGVIDTSKMREALAFAVFRAAGVPAPRTTYAEVTFSVPGVLSNVNGGLFTVIEDVNKTFLKRALAPGTGLIMKPEGLRGGIQSLGDQWTSYINTMRPDREATPHEQQRMIEFAKLVSQTDVALFRSKIGDYLDVDEFLRFIAVNALIVNTDSYLGMGHNFYLYLDPKDDKFRFIPWDQDLSMGGRAGPLGGGLDVMQPFRGDHPLLYWLLDDPAVSARYRAILRELSTGAFSSTEVLKIADALEHVGPTRINSPRAFIEQRTEYLRQLVATWK